MKKLNLFWFRRDMRLEDNAGLYHALRSGLPVLAVFIFDKNILDKLEDKNDARVEFIHQRIAWLKKELRSLGSDLLVCHGQPEKVWTKLLKQYAVQQVFTNRDYEPYALERDAKVKGILTKNGVEFKDYKDHVIFERNEILKGDETPYVVFTPYSKKWREKLTEKKAIGKGKKGSYYLQAYPNKKYFKHFLPIKGLSSPSLKELGFEPASIDFPSDKVSQGIIKAYHDNRNFPAIAGTSKLGIHFRFGTISVREKARKAMELSHTFVNELIWRDFYTQILALFPHVADSPFRPKYAMIEWRNNEAEFEAWCTGKTGYPIVDAGMRELNATGFMHNRVRMLVGSFLCKHLLIDWRWGEAYFAEKLHDYDMSSNIGNWQWVAGSGVDAAPYFRIFNPTSQILKFDKEFKYIRKWVPEYGTDDYLEPIVDHKLARERCLATYKEGILLAKGEA